jgi:nicotinamide-nucleotide amidase
MVAEIITIGDELLIGQVIDTNSAWIAEQLNLVGIRVHQITSISDSREHILATLKDAGKRGSLVLMTGGLGPTKDDITKHTLCEFFDTPLVFHPPTFANVEKLFKARGFEVTEINRRQAEVPESCLPLENPHGTAPGLWFEKEGIIYVSMPGVPFEMKPMITSQVLPRVAHRLNKTFIEHQTVLTQGVGESMLAQIIENWEDNLPGNIKLAYLPQPGIVRLRMTAIGDNRKVLKNLLDKKINELRAIIPDLIFGFNHDTMEGVVGKLLKEKKRTLSTAESCTGGYIAHLITSIPGSSDYYTGSTVSYSNEVKTMELGVDAADIKNHGAVSKAVVSQMAAGARKKFKTDFALAVSGIAGPDGGSEEKPVGTTWIALETPETIITKKFLFGEHRGRNIRKAALAALNMLRLELLDIENQTPLASH